MKNFFLKNKKAAAVILCVVILLSLTAGTARSLASKQAKLDRAYTAKDEYGECVRNVFESLYGHANSFQSSYISAVGSDEMSNELNEAIRAIESHADETSSGLYNQYRTICRVTVDMYSRLMTEDKFNGNARSAYLSLDNDISILSHFDSYNETAEEYNGIVSAFPASLFGFGKAPVFG